MSYTPSNLIVHPTPGSDTIVAVDPATAGWDLLHFQARSLAAQQTLAWNTGDSELALVLLGGVCSVLSNRGEWQGIGRRANVFDGLPHALYLPRQTELTIAAATDCEIALGWCAAEQDYEPKLITPAEVEVEIRGGDNATRQINNIISPGFACQRLVVVEVYTPSGNWSSYPPHKHDVHRTDGAGNVLEADLEEIYFYKFSRPTGYGYQRIYTDDRSTDALLLCRSNDLVLVPHGYHPVVAAPGAHAYYLNILAGSAQSLANSDDPEHAWIKASYAGRDPRVPLYPLDR
ncbi:MAG TPA: 5-deoxy-glucuronate isomerase [Herpetosiphonaceae bacterium]